MPRGAVTIKIDDREFKAALRQIVKSDKKEMSFVLNDQAYRLAAAAMDHTKKAQKASINKLFRINRIGPRPEGTKKGRSRRGAKGNARAFGAYNAWRKLKYGYGEAEGRVSYDTIEKHANVRRKSIGWVKSQWLRAMERVSTSGKGFKKKPKGVASVPPTNKLGGWGKKAKPAINPFALIGVKMDEKGAITGKVSGDVERFLIAGLRAAIPARTLDMKKKLEQRLAKIHKRHSAR
jgi:hypothetical protein